MLKKVNRKTWCCICCLMLACALFFYSASLNVQASESCEVSVIGVTLWNNRVYTTLHCEEGTKPDTVTISYYLDGAPLMTESNRSIEWVDDMAQLMSQSTVSADLSDLTVVVDIETDASAANNNRTVVLRSNMPEPPVLGEETEPEETNPSHTCSYSASQTVAPTCTTGGYTVYSCSCGASYTGDTTSATGHSWSDWVVTKEATTEAEGEETRTCGTCGAKETRTTDKLTGGTGTVDAQPVEELEVFSAPADCVTLTWEAPASGTAPTAYAIYNGDNLVATIDAENLSYTVTGLSANTTYTFKVVAMVNDTASAATQVTVTTAAASVDSGQADLVVTDIRFSPENPKAGDSVVFTAVVKNQGTKATPEGTIVGVRFGIGSIEGTPFTWCDNYTKSVAPGESVLLTVNGGSSGASWTPGSAGTYSIHAWVDDQGRIEESDTDNNDNYSESITVSAEGTPVIPQGTVGDATVYVASSVGSGLTQSSGIVVTVNNKTSPVFNANVNNSRYWDTLIIDTTPVTIFELSKEDTSAVVRVALSRDMNSVIVRPLSDGIKPVIKEENGQRYAEFTITKWGSYTVEFNGSTSKALHLFVNPPYTEYSQNPSAYGFSGYEYIGLGSVSGKNYFDGNNRVYGSGVIKVDGGQPSTTVNSGARLVGITFLNPSSGPSWNMQICGSQDDIEFNYFHMITCGKNSDGITIQSSHNVRILNSYLRAWDDCVVLKIYTPDDTYNVTVNNCVFWSDLAQAMEIGAETNKASGGYNADPEIYNVVFSNNDVIHAFHKPALSIHNMDNAKVHGITYENITIEDASMGNNTRANEDGWPILIDITNTKGAELDGTASGWTNQWDSYGAIYDITYKNIQVLSWANQNTVFDTADNVLPGIRAVNSARISGGGGSIYNIYIQGLHYLKPDGTVLSINSVADLKNNTFSPNDVKGTQTFNPYDSGKFIFTSVTNPDIKDPADYTATAE